MQKLTKAEARRAVRWFQKRLGMQDWRIDVELGPRRPAWDEEEEIWSGTIGRCQIRTEHKHAGVWVPLERCEINGDCPLETLFHELMHCAARDATVRNDNDMPLEHLWWRLGEVLAVAYRKERTQ